MDTNHIRIIDKSGNEIKCEIVLKYYDQVNKKNYVVYNDGNECYAAKFDDVLGWSSLDTNLSEEELNKLSRILENKE